MKTLEPSIPFTPNSSTVTVVSITDPTAIGDTIEVIAQDAMQLRSTPLRAKRVVVRLGSSVLLFHSTNLPIRTRTVLNGGLVSYVAFGPRAAGTLNGLQVGPDRVLATSSGIEVNFVVEAGYQSAAFLVPPDDIRAHLRRGHREDQIIVPQGIELLQTIPGAGARLFEWGRRVADAAVKFPEEFDAPQTNSSAEIELFEMLLSSLGSAVEAKLDSLDVTRRIHSQIVKSAEDHALAHSSRHLYVTELCEAAGVSERTLQYAFKEVTGLTPIAYLTRLRLHRVRHALRSASPRASTVTREALRWGFWHFGDFTRAYKDCFGELPSETLRRSSEFASPMRRSSTGVPAP
jgi:AraC-like DNA-binding protein